MLENHTLNSILPPNILVGYLDFIEEGLKSSITSMEENHALNTICFMLEPDQVALAPKEIKPTVNAFRLGLAQMHACRDTLMAIEGITLCLRASLATKNGVGTEPQHTTAAFAADMMSHELSMDNDSI